MQRWWFKFLILVLSPNILDEPPNIIQISCGSFLHQTDTTLTQGTWLHVEFSPCWPLCQVHFAGTTCTRICGGLFKFPNFILFSQLPRYLYSRLQIDWLHLPLNDLDRNSISNTLWYLWFQWIFARSGGRENILQSVLISSSSWLQFCFFYLLWQASSS